MKPLLTMTCACMALAIAANPVLGKPRPYRPTAPSETGPMGLREANEAARVRPATEAFANANQVYAYADGALFQVYTSVGKVTDIILQPEEHLSGAGPVAAGDTARWIIGDTESGPPGRKQVHILVKPTLSKLSTNLVINTDRRTYHIELHSLPDTYMSSVSWRYPQDELLAIQQATDAAAARAPIISGIEPTALDFGYRIDGPKVAWRPVRAFSDGHKVFVELPAGIGTTDLPPLFILGADKKAELVNYRVTSRFIIVDRLFETAEMRIGDKTSQKIVRIKWIGAPRS